MRKKTNETKNHEKISKRGIPFSKLGHENNENIAHTSIRFLCVLAAVNYLFLNIC